MRIPQKPPNFTVFLPDMLSSEGLRKAVFDAAPTLSDGRYLHWEELRYREPPEGLTPEQWWSALKFARERGQVVLEPMNRCYGTRFSFVPLPAIQKTLHELDRTNVGRTLLSGLANEDAATEYRVRQLIEEAISSSVIEGARPTTREQARQMVREQRTPSSHDEQMIYNNWRAMRRIVELRDEDRALTVDDLLELHRIVGEDALDSDGGEGVFRKTEDRVSVEDFEGNVWHVPPDAEGLRDRVATLLRFAEGAEEQASAPRQEFIHPILRAIVAHFWLAYEHPFRDGNGRMARALFYWCMLRHGYEMAEFLSISGPIDRSPRDYYMAFAFTETDDGDLTYFMQHQLRVIEEALRELVAHLRARAQRMQELAALVREFDELNHRQRALLQHAIRHPLESYTIDGHASSHRVHYQTARNDFIDLTRRGFFSERRVGNAKRFFPSKELIERIESS